MHFLTLKKKCENKTKVHEVHKIFHYIVIRCWSKFWSTIKFSAYFPFFILERNNIERKTFFYKISRNTQNWCSKIRLFSFDALRLLWTKDQLHVALIKWQLSRTDTSLKRGSSTGIFLWILCNFPKTFIYGAALDDCSCWFLQSS